MFVFEPERRHSLEQDNFVEQFGKAVLQQIIFYIVVTMRVRTHFMLRVIKTILREYLVFIHIVYIYTHITFYHV